MSRKGCKCHEKCHETLTNKVSYFSFCDWATKKYNYLSDLDLSQEYIRRGKIYQEYISTFGDMGWNSNT